MLARILVIDPDRNMRELLALHLRGVGYEVDLAADGISAGYSILRARPDLIISEVALPRVHGFDLIDTLKRDPSLSGIALIFVTKDTESGKELAGVSCLTKPIRSDSLISLVARHVQGGLVPIG